MTATVRYERKPVNVTIEGNEIEALAGMAGVSLTPAVKSALAELDRDDAARIVQAIIGAAKEQSKAVSEGGAAAEQVEEEDPEAEPKADDAKAKPSAKPPKTEATQPKRAAKKPKRPASKKPKPTSTPPAEAEDDD